MTSSYPKGIIEIGNINIKCIIFNITENNISEILSTSIVPSEGIHNGTIVNLKKASNAIRSCITTAEKKSDVVIKKISVVLDEPEFLCTKFSKHRNIGGSKIYKDDIEFLLKEAKKEVVRNDESHSIIHIFNHNYIVDKKIFLEEPIDVYADNLRHQVTFITMPKNNIRNIKQAFMDCDIEIDRFISSIFASAVKLLNEDELTSGSILIDVDSEKISIGLFKNLAIIHTSTFPVGTNHIAKDVAKVCSLTLEESENIIEKLDFLFLNNKDIFDDKSNLKKSFFQNTKFRKISKSLIQNIVEARLDEIFEMIKKQIAITKLNSEWIRNIFIVGEGSGLSNIQNYCSKFFEVSIKTIDKSNEIENFVSCLGALKIIKDGWETEAIAELPNKNHQKIGFLTKFFGKKI